MRFDGQSIGGPQEQLATPDIAQLGIAYVPESMGIFADLTVRENLLLAARSARRIEDIDAARLERLFEMFPALPTTIKSRCTTSHSSTC